VHKWIHEAHQHPQLEDLNLESFLIVN